MQYIRKIRESWKHHHQVGSSSDDWLERGVRLRGGLKVPHFQSFQTPLEQFWLWKDRCRDATVVRNTSLQGFTRDESLPLPSIGLERSQRWTGFNKWSEYCQANLRKAVQSRFTQITLGTSRDQCDRAALFWWRASVDVGKRVPVAFRLHRIFHCGRPRVWPKLQRLLCQGGTFLDFWFTSNTCETTQRVTSGNQTLRRLSSVSKKNNWTKYEI